MTNIRKVIEAALFMSPHAISFNELLRISGGNVFHLRKAITELTQKYHNNESALEIVETFTGFRMKVREELEDNVTHFAASSEFNKSALRTLALIAYKQPIKQSLVVKYRSNKAYDDIKLLEEKGFISRETSDRTYLVRTTKKFLKYFGEDSIKLVPLNEDEREAFISEKVSSKAE